MKYCEKGIDVLFSVLQKEYELEDNRSKQLETKSQVLLAVSGIIISSLLLLLFKLIYDYGENKAIEIPLVFFTFLILLFSMYYFLSVFKIEKYIQLDNKNLISHSSLNLGDKELKYHLSHDYLNCINHNVKLGNKKAENIKCGISLILVALILLLVAFVTFTCGIVFESEKNLLKINHKIGNNTN